MLDATFASVSRVIGDLLVELSGYRRDGASTRSSCSSSPTTR